MMAAPDGPRSLRLTSYLVVNISVVEISRSGLALGIDHLDLFDFQWARDEFEGLFKQPAENVNQYLT